MTRAAFEALPLRDELVNEPIEGQYYRALAYPRNVFRPLQRSDVDWTLLAWECYSVDLSP